MTDKEQQIICKYKLLNVKKFDGQPYCSCFSESCKNLPICDDNCQIFEDYKQLVRKTQECEELKEKYKWYDHYKDSALLNKKLCDKASDERARYRKALEEIEEFIEEEDWSILDYVFKRIKDIISKAFS